MWLGPFQGISRPSSWATNYPRIPEVQEAVFGPLLSNTAKQRVYELKRARQGLVVGGFGDLRCLADKAMAHIRDVECLDRHPQVRQLFRHGLWAGPCRCPCRRCRRSAWVASPKRRRLWDAAKSAGPQGLQPSAAMASGSFISAEKFRSPYQLTTPWNAVIAVGRGRREFFRPQYVIATSAASWPPEDPTPPRAPDRCDTSRRWRAETDGRLHVPHLKVGLVPKPIIDRGDHITVRRQACERGRKVRNAQRTASPFFSDPPCRNRISGLGLACGGGHTGPATGDSRGSWHIRHLSIGILPPENEMAWAGATGQQESSRVMGFRGICGGTERKVRPGRRGRERRTNRRISGLDHRIAAPATRRTYAASEAPMASVPRASSLRAQLPPAAPRELYWKAASRLGNTMLGDQRSFFRHYNSWPYRIQMGYFCQMHPPE